MAPVFFAVSIMRKLNACSCSSYQDFEEYCYKNCIEPCTFGEYWETTQHGMFYLNIPRRLRNQRGSVNPSDVVERSETATSGIKIQLQSSGRFQAWAEDNTIHRSKTIPWPPMVSIDIHLHAGRQNRPRFNKWESIFNYLPNNSKETMNSLVRIKRF